MNMIGIKGGLYNWNTKQLNEISQRIINGDCVTINDKKKKAYINYYVGKDTMTIPFDYAVLLAKLHIIEIESGNHDFNEEHFYIKSKS